MCILTYKPTVQYTDMYSHRHRPDIATHKYMCKTGMHIYIYAHRHVLSHTDTYTHIHN